MQNVWYANQRLVVECLGCDFFHDLAECINIYYSQDSQFPPDVVKSCRLYSLLREYNPSSILEIGCGTSSMVISKYLFDLGNETSAMCVDANKEWLNLTRSKIKRVSSLDPDRVDWVEWSESEYVKIKILFQVPINYLFS